MESSGIAAGRPLLVITAHELDAYLRDYAGESQGQQGGYSEEFTWRKTDFGASVDQAQTASRLILGGDVRAVGGWIVAETTGTAGAAFRLHDGGNAQAEAFGRINLAAGESTRDFIARDGIRCYTGRVFMEFISGSFEGVLIWR